MGSNLHRIFLIALLLIGVSTTYASRIKDITNVEGTRDNQLIGYGLVVGLAGTGDGSMDFTKQSLINALKEFGVKIEDVKAKNVAAVMITADIGPFMKPGSRLDVTVSSIGDASTIQGGILLQTPLIGADGTVYAVAQGPIAIGGFLGGGGGDGGASVQQNHPTVGKIASGAIIEREIPTKFLSKGYINLLLANPDFASAVRTADAVNKYYPGTSQAMNSAVVNVKIPESFKGQVPNFIASVGMIDVMPDITARVIINERTGTIVATSNVRISTVAVSHGSLTITINNTQEASQPNALSETGETVVVPNTQANVTEVRGGFSIVNDYPTIERLTTALNALGVTTREMMSILQAIKSAGALQAELVLN